jgi:predicted dehydrogenase
MPTPLRIGILGAAKIAPTAVINPATKRDDVVIACVAARDPARAQAYAAEHGIAATAIDYAALIDRDDLDLIYNALPPAGHPEWTIRALEAGKAVLCEKPFARSAALAKTMTDAAVRAGKPLIEAFHYRYHTVIRRAEAIVRAGELGDLTAAEAVFQVPIPFREGELRWIDEQGGGALMDLGCYPIHALRTLIGSEPTLVSAHAVLERGVDVETRASLRFGEVPATVACAMNAVTPAARLTLTGTRGTLDIINFLAPQMGCAFTVTVDGVSRQEDTMGPSTYEAQLAHVVDVMRHGAAPLTGGADAVANMTVIDAIRGASRGLTIQ